MKVKVAKKLKHSSDAVSRINDFINRLYSFFLILKNQIARTENSLDTVGNSRSDCRLLGLLIENFHYFSTIFLSSDNVIAAGNLILI